MLQGLMELRCHVSMSHCFASSKGGSFRQASLHRHASPLTVCTVNTFPPQLPVITAGPGSRILGQTFNQSNCWLYESYRSRSFPMARKAVTDWSRTSNYFSMTYIHTHRPAEATGWWEERVDCTQQLVVSDDGFIISNPAVREKHVFIILATQVPLNINVRYIMIHVLVRWVRIV